MPPPPTPTEKLATIIRCLTGAVWTRNHSGLSLQLIALITGKLREISQRFARIAASIQAGRYVFRRRSAPATPRTGPRTKSPLPRNPGWLLKLVPAAVGYRSQLESLLRDTGMAALLAAAPASLARPLRALCRMLLVEPPAILPPPAGARPKKTPKAERPAPKQRRPKPERVRYVFGLRHPPPFPDPV